MEEELALEKFLDTNPLAFGVFSGDFQVMPVKSRLLLFFFMTWSYQNIMPDLHKAKQKSKCSNKNRP